MAVTLNNKEENIALLGIVKLETLFYQ